MSVSAQRSIIIAAVLFGLAALSLIAGYVVAADRLRVGLVIFGPLVALIAVFFFSRQFEYIVLLLPFTALVAPFDLPTGTYSRIPIVLALTLALCAMWVASMFIRRRWRLEPSPLNRPALLFGAACIVSFIWGTIWRDPVIQARYLANFFVVQSGSLATFLASIGAALLIGNFVQTERRLKYIVGCFLLFGSLMTVLQILRINHHTFTDGGLWGMWTVVPAYGLLIAQPKIHWRWRVLLALLIAANLYQTMLVNVLWKSGWVPTLIAMAFLTLMRSWRWFLVLMVASAFLAYSEQSFFAKMTEDEIDEGATQRIGMWEINLRIIGDHLVFGTGPAGYAPYYMTYYPEDARSTHNNYLDIIAQFGVVGSALWLWFAAAGTLEGIRLYREAPPGFLRTLAMVATSGWLGAQASMMLGDWVLPFAYNQTITGFKYTVYTWIFLGALISIRHIIRQQHMQTVQVIV